MCDDVSSSNDGFAAACRSADAVSESICNIYAPTLAVLEGEIHMSAWVGFAAASVVLAHDDATLS
eukprot:4488123-Prymnesium_polylepis.1